MKLKDVWPQQAFTGGCGFDFVLISVADREGAIPGQSHMARGGMAG